MKQKFYLVVAGELRQPLKIFLQEDKAIKYGKLQATKHKKQTFHLMEQEITTPAIIKYTCELKAYRSIELKTK